MFLIMISAMYFEILALVPKKRTKSSFFARTAPAIYLGIGDQGSTGQIFKFGRVQIAAARLVTGARKYHLIPLVLHVLAASGVFKGATEPCLFWPRNQFLTKEKIGEHDLPSLFILKKSKHSNVDTN